MSLPRISNVVLIHINYPLKGGKPSVILKECVWGQFSVCVCVWAAWQSLYISFSSVCECVCVNIAHSYCRSHRHREKVRFLSRCPSSCHLTLSLKARRRCLWSIHARRSSLSLSHPVSVTLRSAYSVFSTSFLTLDCQSVWLTDIFWTRGWVRAFLMSHENVFVQ